MSGVTASTLRSHTLAPGAIYPGTPHHYQVYVPARHDPARLAPLMVFLDGPWIFVERMGAPAVLDALIGSGDVPPLIGIFVDPGVLPVADHETQQPRVNRHLEYDAVTGRFSRFLLDELLPAVARDVALSADPNDRGLAGLSSGAVGALAAAWERPDQFRRVFSGIGTFVDMHGAQVLPFWMRKSEPKPLRVFVQETTGDHDIVYGSWPLGNQALAAALAYAGYDHTFVVGPGGHDLEHATAILPEALRWLWRDYPRPIAASTTSPIFDDLLLPDHPWEPVAAVAPESGAIAADRAGSLYVANPADNRIDRIAENGEMTPFAEQTAGARGLAAGADGRLYAIQPDRERIVAYREDGREETVAEAVDAFALAMTANGMTYATIPDRHAVVTIDGTGRPVPVAESAGIGRPTTLALSPDQAFLAVVDTDSDWMWSFQRAPDDTLRHGQPFFRVEGAELSGLRDVEGIAVDTRGELYVPTALGITVVTQSGRSRDVIAAPAPGMVSAVAFGGRARNWLYATQQGRLFRRRIRRQGAVPWEPTKPPPPHL